MSNNNEMFTYGMIGLVAGLALGSKTGREILGEALKGGFTLAMIKPLEPCKHPFIEVKKNRSAFCVYCHAPTKLLKGRDITKKRKH